MSDDTPCDLFDAICRLDDIAEWLEQNGYGEHAERLKNESFQLKDFIVLRLNTPDHA